METITLLVVAVVIPAAAILTYWAIARGQVRRATSETERRLEAERELTARVSHQVRNPLTVIYGFSEALLDTDMDDADEIRSVVSIINAEALGVSRTVENLVAENQVATNQLSVRSIAFRPAKELTRAVTPFTRGGAEITVESPDVIGQSDPILFRQVVQNLVSNAVRHGGSEISIVAVLKRGSYQCTVADNGPGLPLGIAAELFASADPMTASEQSATDQRQDREPSAGEVSGTSDPIVMNPAEDALGIGLSTSISLAEKLGGSVTYERTAGASMFTLELPTTDWPAVPKGAAPVSDPADSDADSEDSDEPDNPPPPIPHHDDSTTITFDPSVQDGDETETSNISEDSDADEEDAGVDDTVEAGSSA